MKPRLASTPPFKPTFEALIEAALDAKGGDPHSAADWAQKQIARTQDLGWVYSLLKDLLDSDDYYAGLFVHSLQASIAKFIATEAGEAIYALGGEEEKPAETWPGENPYGPYGRIM